MNKAAFFSVVYPGVEAYLVDFFSSLEKQTSANFDLVIANDGLDTLDVSAYLLKTRVVTVTGTPAQIREAGLKFLRDQGYELVIFGDSDDYFSANRVEIALELLQSYDVVVNELDLVDERGGLLQSGYLSKRVVPGAEIPAEFIRDKNIFGLSNTAVRVSSLPKQGIPSELVAVDWFLFGIMLEGGAKAVFSSASCTSYRQHGSNTAGLARQSPQKILPAVRVKAIHYAAMATAGMTVYCDWAKEFRALHQRLLDDATFFDEYINYLKHQAENFPLWWEYVLLPKELS